VDLVPLNQWVGHVIKACMNVHISSTLNYMKSQFQILIQMVKRLKFSST